MWSKYCSKHSALVLILGVMLVTFAGCDSQGNEAPTSESLDVVETLPQSPTVAPTKVSTVFPTATFEPIDTAHPDLAIEWPTPGTDVRQFHEELKPTSERLDKGEVEALWTALLTDSQIDALIVGGKFDIRICSSGRGLATSTDQAGEHYLFDWAIRQSAGGRWNEAILDLTNPVGTFASRSAGYQVVLQSDERGFIQFTGAPMPPVVEVVDYPECPL